MTPLLTAAACLVLYVLCVPLVLRLPRSRRRHASAPTSESVCPLCSRPMHPDWLRPSGACCDCDEELGAIARYHSRHRSLTSLNPNLFSAGRQTQNQSSTHETDAPSCDGPRPDRRSFAA